MANWEYQKYHSSPRMKAERVIRNRNRRKAERGGVVRKGDGKPIAHRDGNVWNNSSGNLRVTSGSYNRRKQ